MIRMRPRRPLRPWRGLHTSRPAAALPAATSSPSAFGRASSAAGPPPLASSGITDAEINALASQPIHPLTLSDLVKHGHPPLSAPALLASARSTAALLPARLAHRVRALRALPYIVVANPHVAQIHANYLHSLETLRAFHRAPFATLEEEVRFTDALADLVQSHANTIPTLARGFLECRRYLPPDAATRFLDEHLRARIGTRLVAEQHLALHLSAQPHAAPDAPSNPPTATAATKPQSSYIGVIDTALRPAPLLSLCEAFVGELCELRYGVRPALAVTGDPAIAVSHVPTHLEYILTELLKNAFRATVEAGREREPVEVTVALSREGDADHDLGLGALDAAAAAATAQQAGSGGAPVVGGGACGPGDETLTIRIRDRGGGIAPNHLPYVWGYNFTTFTDGRRPGRGTGARDGSSGSGSDRGSMDALDAIAANGAAGSSIAGLGYGLPLSRAYAEYFGGSIALQSLWGWGTDVYLRLKGLRGV